MKNHFSFTRMITATYYSYHSYHRTPQFGMKGVFVVV